MPEPIVVTATLPAWVTSTASMEHVLDNLRSGKSRESVNEMLFSSWDMDVGSNPWTRIGEAQITVTLVATDELVANQLRTLKAELENARAEFLTKQHRITEQISKLQAITHQPKEE